MMASILPLATMIPPVADTPGVALGLIAFAVALLLGLVLVLRLHALLALLLVSLVVAVVGGIPLAEVADKIREAMGGTLGYISIVIGVGAIFGEMLRRSGGVRVIADSLLAKLGEERAPTALGLTGLVVAIPVFFDVAFILLVPLVRTIAKRTGKAVIGFAIPLLAGLAVAHAFVPPTPGPVAVAGLLGADLGWVIAFGLAAGVPALLVGGLGFGRFLARKAASDENPSASDGHASADSEDPSSLDYEESPLADAQPDVLTALGLVILPLLAILGATASSVWMAEGPIRDALKLAGHPFVALIFTTLLASWLLSKRCGWSRAEVERMATKALEPVGAILLLTGAGGVLGKVLLATGAGQTVALWLTGAGSDSHLSLLVLAFALALVIRIAQGSATVSMVTAAGLIAPVVESGSYSAPLLAALTIAIAAGATAFSHVNDSGFWLVSRYLGIDEKQTLRTWTVMTALVGGIGLLSTLALASVVVSGEPTPADDTPVAAAEREETSSERPTVGRLEAIDARFFELIEEGSPIEVLAEGFEWSEGPVWVAGESASADGFLLFSDVPRNVIHRWSEDRGLEDWLRPSGYTGSTPRAGEPGSNGLFLDLEGRLLVAQHGDRRIARLEAAADGSWQHSPEPRFETLADRFEGKRFDSPNDLVIDSRGRIYFTDPPYGLDPEGPGSEMGFQGVYRIDTDGTVRLASKNLSRPNGIHLSPDESTLYVANSDPERAVWIAWDLASDGSITNERPFYDATDQVGEANPGLPDGLAVDSNGHLFATGPGGVLVFAPGEDGGEGIRLGTIRLPGPAANCTFGDDGRSLYITSDAHLLRVRTRARGSRHHDDDTLREPNDDPAVP